MTELICPHGDRIDVFPPVGRELSMWSRGVERRAIAIDARVGAESVRGRSLMLDGMAGELAATFRDLGGQVTNRLLA